MAFILRSSKYVYNFLGLAHRASLTCRRKKVLLLEHMNLFKNNELWARTAATAPKPVLAFPFSGDKTITQLHNNLKANMVDLEVVQLTLNSLKECGAMTPSQLLLLLKCCGNAAYKNSEHHRVNLARNIWETARELGTEFDIAHYNGLLTVFVENNYKFSPDEILSDIKQSGLEPNKVTYKRLLKAFCQQGNIQGASSILEEMKLKKVPISEYDFCSLIQGHCEAGELDEAVKIFNVMKERGVQPSLDPYVYLLCGYAKHGNIQKIEELLDELNNLNLRMTDAYLLNIVYTLIVNNRSEHVDSILARMKKGNDYEKTLMAVVHKILHRNKDEEALKLFAILKKMNCTEEYVRDQAFGIIEHFVYNRTPKEVLDICQRILGEGWTMIGFSHALKKAVLRKDLEYCVNLLQGMRKNSFPIRSHYFWPLIVRYSEHGNSGVLSVLRAMKTMSVAPCLSTLKTFIKEYYQFGDNWENDISVLTKLGAKESQVCLIVLNDILAKKDIEKAENLASSYGIFRPQRQTINLLVKCFAKLHPLHEEKFLNILYYLSHDFIVYNSHPSQDANDCEEDNELTGLSTFFDAALHVLMENCSEDIFLSLLQNASKQKIIISSQMAASIRENFKTPEVEALLKEFAANTFEVDQEILKKKSENATLLPKSLDRSGVLNLANRNDMKVEKVWEEVKSKASLEEHLAMMAMYVRLNLYDKAFEIADGMRNLSSEHIEEQHKRRFRVTLHLLRKSGNVEKMISAYKTGVALGLIDDDHVIPVVRTILNHCDVDVAVGQHPEFFEKIKNVGSFFEVLEQLIPTGNTAVIDKLVKLFSASTSENVALTTLFAAYLAAGRQAEAKALLESQPFKFQPSVFIWWFRNAFSDSEKTFEDAMEIISAVPPHDRTSIYSYLLNKYERERNYDNIKSLWLQCQEDNITDQFFLEQLSRCVREGKNSHDSGSSNSNMQWDEEKDWRKIQELLKVNKYTEETFERLMSGKLPSRIARKMLPVLAGEGKSFELILIINKYKFGRFIPEIASEMLNNNKVKQFFEFVGTLASMKKYGGVYNCFASQQDRILELTKSEEFFEKFMDLSLRCYEEGKYEALLVFFIKICVQLPQKLAKAEELLGTDDSRIISHFRNYSLSSMLLNSSEEVDFYKNVLSSEKVKRVFSEALDHFYDRVINFYNENDDVERALSYLERAKADGVEEKLSKELISSLKKKLEHKGTPFPYPQLLQEAA